MNRLPVKIDETLSGRACEMIKTFQSGYFFSALSLALSIPDICGSRLFPEEKNCGVRYAKWFNRYVAYQYLNEAFTNEDSCDRWYFDGDDCYQLRCVFLHEGTNAPHVDRKKTIYHVAQFRVFSTKPGIGIDHVGRTYSEDKICFCQVDLDLGKFLFAVKACVEAFVSEYPYMNSFNPIGGSRSVLYAPIIDFRN